MINSGKRLKILSNAEIKSIYGIPQFEDEERKEYFFVSVLEEEILENLKSIKSKAYFILQLGYFRMQHQFFNIDFEKAKKDIEYILELRFNNSKLLDIDVSKATRLKQQNLILKLCNYQHCSSNKRQEVKSLVQKLSKIHSKPLYIFRGIIEFLEEERLIILGYSVLQDIIGSALNNENKRLITILQESLGNENEAILDNLLQNPETLYEITILKREPKDFNCHELLSEIRRGEKIKDLYYSTKILITQLEISNENVKYYASLVDYYSVFQLKQFNVWMAYLYLLCFINYRYCKLDDNLIKGLIYYVRKYISEAKKFAKECVYQYKHTGSKHMREAGLTLGLFSDDNISDQVPFVDVKNKAFKILDKPKISFMSEYIATNAKCDEAEFEWEYISKIARKFKLRLRNIISTVNFESSSENALLKAIETLKLAFQQKKVIGHSSTDTVPTDFISKQVKSYLYCKNDKNKKEIIPERYEFLVYKLLRNGVESGDIFCKDSISYCKFEDDLITDEEFEQKDKLIEDTRLFILNTPIEKILSDFEDQLEPQITKTNKNILNNVNPSVTFKKQRDKTDWKFHHVSPEEDYGNSYFDSLEQVSIREVLETVDKHCNFLDVFEHVLGRYGKQPKEKKIISATCTALATNMGIGKMGQISDIGYQKLSDTSKNFIYPENLKKANDIVSNKTESLAIFSYYNIDNAVHSSSDGQKFETDIHTMNSSHSKKYFGLKKGVVSYNMVANNIPVDAKIIGAHDHESHYVHDILQNNSSDIRPETHSTDSHGVNNANFLILHIFGYQFAPRYKDIKSKTDNLCGFKNPSSYDKSFLIKPSHKVDKKLIIDEWENNIQKILLSLAVKKTTQSNIVSKLSSYKRKNRTKKAIWEFNNIINSLYIYKYLDDIPLQRNVQKSLNRGELYHTLVRTIKHINSGRFRVKSDKEQHIWNECSRLIANCVICYNSILLSELLRQKQAAGDWEAVEELKKVSPISWQHINFHGKYEFDKNIDPVDILEVVRKMMKNRNSEKIAS